MLTMQMQIKCIQIAQLLLFMYYLFAYIMNESIFPKLNNIPHAEKQDVVIDVIDNSRKTIYTYESEIGGGGMVRGGWSTGGYDSKYTYDCSGVAGSTDC